MSTTVTDQPLLRLRPLLLSSTPFRCLQSVRNVFKANSQQIPAIVSGIIYAANTVNHIEYVDCLFIAVSAATTTGLATLDLSALNGFQQACLMVSFICGSLTFVSTIMLLVRQHFFRVAFRDTIVDQRRRRRVGKRVRRRSGHVSRSLPAAEQTGPDTADDAKSLRDASETGHELESVHRLARSSLSDHERVSPAHPTGSGLSVAASASLPAPRLHIAIDRTMTETTARRRRGPGDSVDMPRTATWHSGPRYTNYGGFPMPFDLAHRLARKVAPNTTNKLERTLSEAPDTESNGSPFASFRPNVGRNSLFLDMTTEQKEEMGGIEYRASKLLLRIVYCYIFAIPVLAFTIVAPLLTVNERYADFFASQHRRVATPWFSAFNVWSAFTNCGMSLSDTSMIPFINEHLFVFGKSFPPRDRLTRTQSRRCSYLRVTMPMYVPITTERDALTIQPIMLRCIVWILHKLSRKDSRLAETTSFLLQHPRRCFLYLFPSQQTWYLLAVVFTLTSIDFAAFLILDIGNETIESIPVGTRMLAALMQSAAVRVEGFSIVPLAALVPAVQVLYVVMMYVAVLPLALMVRSTNVYEDQTLGIYKETSSDENEVAHGSAVKYIGWHARKQLAFDMWWLALALWLICIIERDRVTDYTNEPWFNVFTVIFEIVSAYGTVGLSLGSANDNYSLSGNFRPLSKLVIMAVMLRGRHRALPMAIDRAVMLPSGCEAIEQEEDEQDAQATWAAGKSSPTSPKQSKRAKPQTSGADAAFEM